MFYDLIQIIGCKNLKSNKSDYYHRYTVFNFIHLENRWHTAFTNYHPDVWQLD